MLRSPVWALSIASLLISCAAPPPAASSASAAIATRERGRTRVAIVIFDGVNVLDVAGPKEVFEAANGVARFQHEPPPFEVSLVSTAGRAVTTLDRTRLVADFTAGDAPAADVVLVPGGPLGSLPTDERSLAWIRSVSRSSAITMSVCSGAVVLARAGLLEGREVATHHMARADVERWSPSTKVRTDRRYVDDGRTVTTAGVTAGIDGALHVVDRLAGRSTATMAARYVLEYPWDPENTGMTPITMEDTRRVPHRPPVTMGAGDAK
jgi:transcriptional regulator GlxA family with amidase domain